LAIGVIIFYLLEVCVENTNLRPDETIKGKRRTVC
jgi:hypothetical protein